MRTSESNARPPAGEGGFTLLEAVVAMAVLAFGVLTVCIMQSSALRASAIAYNRTEANNVAVALIEALQQLPFGNPALKATPRYNGLGDRKWDLEDGTDTKNWPRTVWLGGDLGQENYRKGGTYKTGALYADGNLRCLPTNDPALKRVLQDRVFTISSDGCEVTDMSGITFLVKLGVQDVNVENPSRPDKPNTTDKIIRIHMEWDTPAGVNHLTYTANKFKTETGSTATN